MADDVVINIRERGGRQTARNVDRVGTGLDRLGRRGRMAAGGVRLFSRATVGATGHMRLMAGAAVTGGAALGGALLIGLKRSSDAWEESRQVAAQTNAVIRSTGGVANVTAGEVEALATRISRKAGVDDEAIQSGSNLLLTFKRIRNEAGAGNRVFDRATQAAVDLSAGGFGSISSASKQLGKALNDPVKGITALNRAGVTFTKGQKDQIATLVEQGDILGAQRIILREVESQVRGSAAAQATPIKRLRVSWENVQETIGKGLSPAVDVLASKLDRFLVRATPAVDRFGDRFGKILKSDATPEMKFLMTRREIDRQFGPFEREIQASIQRMKLGDAFADAFDDAAPRIADSAGKNAGRAARAFLGAWWDADIGGKLFLAGLVSWKLGIFRALGRRAIDQFIGRGGGSGWLSRRLPTPPAPAGAGRLGRRFGVAFGVAAAAGLSIEIGRKLVDLSDQAGLLGGRRGRQNRADWVDRNIPGMRPLRDLGRDLGLEQDPAPRRRRAHPGPVRSRDPHGRVAAPRIPGAGAIVTHTHVHVDGKEVARAVHRHANNAKANRRGG